MGVDEEVDKSKEGAASPSNKRTTKHQAVTTARKKSRCTVCGVVGHRRDNANKCKSHTNYSYVGDEEMKANANTTVLEQSISTNGNAQMNENARVGNFDLAQFQRLSLADSFLAIREEVLMQESLGKDDGEGDEED